MNKPSPAPEPTMEEILASIRRIISDGDEMAGSPQPAPEPPPARPLAAAPAPAAFTRMDAPEPVDPDPIEDADDAGDAEADIFDLTDAMVADDDAMAAAAAIEASFGAREDDGVMSGAMSSDVADFEAVPAGLVEPDRLDVEFGDTVDGFDAPATSAFADAPEPEPEPEAPPSPVAAEPPMRPAGAMDRPRDDAPPPAAPAVAGPAPDTAARLLSPQTDTVVAAAFGKLADTILSRDPKTLEDLVKDMLRPMLKDWLDDNLPVLVERLVREEIERVSRGRR